LKKFSRSVAGVYFRVGSVDWKAATAWHIGSFRASSSGMKRQFAEMLLTVTVSADWYSVKPMSGGGGLGASMKQ
jgi:hypothetical protein